MRAKEQPDPMPDLYRLRAGYAESPGWFMVQALEFDPLPLTVADLRVRDIYASESLVQGLLEVMASEKWLHRQGDSYFLSETGRALQKTLRGRAARWLAALQPLPAAEMERLESQMAQDNQGQPGPALSHPAPGAWPIHAIALRQMMRHAVGEDLPIYGRFQCLP